MAENGDDQRNEHVLEDPPVRDIHVDVLRTREDVRMSAKWLVLFRKVRPNVYDGAFHPTHLEAWILQLEWILEISHVPRQYWVPFATIQLDGVASIWWRDLRADSRTTS